MSIASRRLLVVDDDHDFAESLGDMLELSGYEVEVTFSGDDAIRRCGEAPFDLVLMDVRMPGKSGIESFLEIQRSNPDFRAILMTAHADPGMLAQALSSGAKATIRKPLAPLPLVELIEIHRQRSLVLVIDDDSDFADSLGSMLEDSGYLVRIAKDAESALAQSAVEHPAVILLDLRLPQSSGVEVFHELARRNQQAPTVVLSAYLDEEQDDVRTLRDENVAGILQKPFACDQLLSLLASIPRQ